MNGTVRLKDGTQVYLSRIHEEAALFREALPEDRNLSEPETFTGLISHIRKTVFPCGSDTNDIEGLDRAFTEYCEICATAKQSPVIHEFCAMIGISRDSLTDWRNGRLRARNPEYIHTVKNWFTICESALARKTVSANSVGAIFALKAGYDWRETTITIPETAQIERHATPEEIMERHRNAELPEKPNLDVF